MVIPTRVPLGASTLNRKWYLDAIPDGAPDGAYIGVFGITELTPNPGTTTTQDDSDFDSDGRKSMTATAIEWGAEGKVVRKTLASDATSYDPGQELLRATALELGVKNSLRVRFYEATPDGPRVEAYAGRALVTWTNDGGGMDALSTASFALMGQGKLEAIAHPGLGGAAVPAILKSGPAGRAAGQQVLIEGYNLTGVTAVTFAGVAATSFTVVDDRNVIATLPAGTAGPVLLRVTTPGGVAEAAYTRA